MYFRSQVENEVNIYIFIMNYHTQLSSGKSANQKKGKVLRRFTRLGNVVRSGSFRLIDLQDQAEVTAAHTSHCLCLNSLQYYFMWIKLMSVGLSQTEIQWHCPFNFRRDYTGDYAGFSTFWPEERPRKAVVCPATGSRSVSAPHE